jgi:chromosome segregation ATPase
MGNRGYEDDVRREVRASRFEFRALRKELDLIIRLLSLDAQRSIKLMADFSELKAAWDEVKKDIADAVERLKAVAPQVEDPAIQAELNSIAADMRSTDAKYDALETEVRAVTDAVTGDKLETVYPEDPGEVEGTKPE